MSHADDLDYYRNRIDQEEDRAAETDDPQARRLHLELASRYAQLVSELDGRQRQRLRVVG